MMDTQSVDEEDDDSQSEHEEDLGGQEFQHEEKEEEPDDSFESMANLMMTFDPNSASLLEAEEIADIVTLLHSLWCHERYDIQKIHERNLVFFGDRSQILDRYRKYSVLTVSISKRLADIMINMDGELVKEINDKLNRISANIQYGFDSMVQTYRQLYCNQPELQASLPPLRMDVFFMPMAEEDMKTHQKLIRYFLEVCNRRGYRRQQTALFEPKFTEQGHFTRTYTYACEIGTFIYDAIYPYQQHIWLFSALTEKASVARMCQDYLEKCKDDDIQALVKDRTKFSYRNGLFDARRNMFYPYGVEPDGWDPLSVCANYLDVEFDHILYDDNLHESNDPLDIPTPNIQKILDAQDFEPDVCRWFFASIGRMLFEIGNLDNWQYFPFCKGTAGSGKSTILRLAAKFYNDIDVGNLMSEGQTTFSIEHIYDKMVFFCYDVDDKMNFSLTRWNQMVSGESIAVERKFKIPIQQNWTVGGAFAGNSYPPWVDQAGNVSRRMLIFMFAKMVRDVDTNLYDKCKLEMGAFMKKSVSCYFQLLERFGTRGIWDQGVLPDYFHKTKRQMQAETNPLQSFLQSDKCRIGTVEHVGFNNFRSAYLAYCDELRLPKKRLTKDFWVPIFDPQDIEVRDVPVDSNPADYDGYTARYISGVSLVDQ